MTNTEQLRKSIKDSGIKISAIMESLGIKSYTTMREKINDSSEFTAKEIQILCSLLNLTTKEREEIFFANNTEFNSVSV